MERHEIIEFGTLNGVNYVIGGKLKLSGKEIASPDGHKDTFHVIFFDVTTYKDGKVYNNSSKFITKTFDEKGKFPYPYEYFVTAYNSKLNMIKRELMMNGGVI